VPSPVPALRITVLREGDDVAVVRLAGELDIATGPLLKQRLQQLTTGSAEPQVRRLVLDLSELAFTDVVGLGVLLHAERELADRGGQVRLRHPAPLVRRVVRLLDLDTRLLVEP
jgi:anti-anti-sigma factor